MTIAEYIRQSVGSTRKARLFVPHGRFRAFVSEVSGFLIVAYKPDRDVWKHLQKFPEHLVNDPNWQLEDE